LNFVREGVHVSKIYQAVYVDCPPQRAQAYVLNHFENARRHHGRVMIPLTATLGSRTGAHVTLERDATATFAPSTDGGGLEYQVQIEWTPATNEPLPKFDGTFRVQWDEEFGRCRLVLEGDYEPPLGLVGKAFDAAVGRKIAQSTAQALLESLRVEIESAYRRDLDKA
jgi:hypothetical protein